MHLTRLIPEDDIDVQYCTLSSTGVAILLSISLWKCEIGIEKWGLTLKFHVATWLVTDWHARVQVCRIYKQSISRNATINVLLLTT